MAKINYEKLNQEARKYDIKLLEEDDLTGKIYIDRNIGTLFNIYKSSYYNYTLSVYDKMDIRNILITVGDGRTYDANILFIKNDLGIEDIVLNDILYYIEMYMTAKPYVDLIMEDIQDLLENGSGLADKFINKYTKAIQVKAEKAKADITAISRKYTGYEDKDVYTVYITDLLLMDTLDNSDEIENAIAEADTTRMVYLMERMLRAGSGLTSTRLIDQKLIIKSE